MYAIIIAGGKQYRVEPEGVIEVDRLAIAAGEAYETEQVLLTGQDDTIKIGAPYVAGAKVTGTVLDHFRGRKIIVFKQKRRKNYKRTQGHRQERTRVRIDSIQGA